MAPASGVHLSLALVSLVAEGSVTTSPPPPVSQETQQEVPPASATMGESFTDVGHQDTQVSQDMSYSGHVVL